MFIRVVPSNGCSVAPVIVALTPSPPDVDGKKDTDAFGIDDMVEISTIVGTVLGSVVHVKLTGEPSALGSVLVTDSAFSGATVIGSVDVSGRSKGKKKLT
jgi:hypothetical protein